MYNFQYTFDDEDLQRKFENFLSTTNPDVFSIERYTISKEIALMITSNKSIEIISNVVYYYEAISFKTVRRVYDKKGKVIGKNYHTQGMQLTMDMETETISFLRHKYPTNSWIMIRGLINAYEKLLQMLDKEENQYNVVKYLILQ